MKTHADAGVAVAAAVAGAGVVRRSYGGERTRFAKSATDFATDADLEAERVVRELIAAARPDDAFVGEESGGSGPESDRAWLVDPLCGTLNYAARTPIVAVNVALRQGGRTTVAAVADPFAGEVFRTDGQGAWLNSGGADSPLAPSATSRLVDLNLDGGHPVGSPLGVGLLADEGFRAAFEPRVLSTTLALAWVAAGRRAGYVSEGDLRDSVHFAAGAAVCEAAGCVVSGLDGRPWQDGPDGLLAAADVETHAALLDAVRRVRASG